MLYIDDVLRKMTASPADESSLCWLIVAASCLGVLSAADDGIVHCGQYPSCLTSQSLTDNFVSKYGIHGAPQMSPQSIAATIAAIVVAIGCSGNRTVSVRANITVNTYA